MSDSSRYNQQELGAVIGQIYDCAIDPTLWVPTLSGIRDRVSMAYVHINFWVDNQPGESHARPNIFQPSWSVDWVDPFPKWLADPAAFE